MLTQKAPLCRTEVKQVEQQDEICQRRVSKTGVGVYLLHTHSSVKKVVGCEILGVSGLLLLLAISQNVFV